LGNSLHFCKDFPNSEIRGDFAVNVRNALLHEAETREGWVVRACEPPDRILGGKKGAYVLNRTNFHKALRDEFKDYLDRLRNPSNDNLRPNFLEKMDSICDTEPEIE
jgi:hypothetical protein